MNYVKPEIVCGCSIRCQRENEIVILRMRSMVRVIHGVHVKNVEELRT